MDAADMASGYNDTANDTDTGLDVQVELYSVVWALLGLLSLSVAGLATNAALLASAYCKHSLRSLYYGLLYNLCVVNLLLSLVWLPLHFAQLLRGFSGQLFPGALCYLDICALHALITALVCSVLFLVVQRLFHLWRLSARSTDAVAAAGLLTAWLLGVLAAVAVGMEMPHTVPYAVCIHSVVSFTIIEQNEYGHSTATAVLATLYFIVLVSGLVLLLVMLLVRRQQLSRLLRAKCASNELDLHREQDSSNNSKGDSVLINGDPPPSSHSSRNDGLQLTDTVLEEEEEEDDEEDDTFDLKMRERQRSSGRRHTVANISLADPNAANRRGSLGNMSDRSPTSLANKYQYVRKWSVDIVALQDQLENPTRLSPIPFQELHQRLRIIDQPPPASSPSEEVAATSEVSLTSDSSRPPKKRKTVQLDHRIEEIDDLQGSLEPLSTTEEIPSIVVNTTEGERAPSPVDSVQLTQMDREIRRSSKVIALLLVSILCMVPYSLFQISRGVFLQISSNFKYNMTQVSAVFLLAQAPLLPVLFAWMDPRLYQALRRLKVNLTHLRCVCVCNMGKKKGKVCFEAPGRCYQGTSTA